LVGVFRFAEAGEDVEGAGVVFGVGVGLDSGDAAEAGGKEFGELVEAGLGDVCSGFLAHDEAEGGVGGGPGGGGAAAGPVGDAAIGGLHAEEAVGSGLDGIVDLGDGLFLEAGGEVAEIFGSDPGDGGGGGLLGAAVGVAEEVVDGSGGFEEAGAGEFNFEVAAALEEVLGETVEEVVLFGGVVEGGELDFAEERHGVADFEGGFDGVGESFGIKYRNFLG
jgi:hypothetical protein